MSYSKVFIVLLSIFLIIATVKCKYEPSWDSLDTRPLPQWYDQAKVGIFIHWGVFSVPSFGSEWFWQRWKEMNKTEFVEFMAKNYPPNFTYQDFASDFRAEFFNPQEWADIFAKSGAKYVVLTTKHHEGFTLWPSKSAFSWNAMDVGPQRDLVGDLGKAVRATNLHFGLYHSLYEWFNPMYVNDRNNSWSSSDFVVSKIMPEMRELIEEYRPDIFWSDGEAEAPDSYWKSTEFLAWLYNDSPVKDVIVVNDRWGNDTQCKHGDFFTCGDRSNPGHLLPKKWENAMTIDKKSWGFRRNARYQDYMTIYELLTTLVETVSCGGNILINVGPTKEGMIAPIFQERLLDLGKWLSINGEAIYDTKPWTYQNDTLSKSVWYTTKPTSVYALVLFWPTRNNLVLGSVKNLFENNGTRVEILGNSEEIPWKLGNGGVEFTFPDKAEVTSEWVWVLRITPSKLSDFMY